MGYSSKKLVQRDEISGLHQHVDVPDGSHSVDELTKRAASRLEALAQAIAKDSDPADETTLDHPANGDALSRAPKPSDVSSKGGDRYGVSVSPGQQSAKRQTRDNAKVSR